jgi:hypothetical protein
LARCSGNAAAFLGREYRANMESWDLIGDYCAGAGDEVGR